MLKRQRTGSVLCTSCGVLVGVNDATCYNCGRRNPSLWGFAPLMRTLGNDLGVAPFIMGTCIVLYVVTLALSGGRGGGMLAPASGILALFGSSGAYPVFVEGRWWTVLSAGWLHGNLLHIAFNMMWVRQLVPSVAELYGPGRTAIIYTVAGVAGFALSSFAGAYVPPLLMLRGSAFTVGASASIFGLLGAAVYYGRRTGSRAASSQAWSYALMAGAFGFIMPGIDNYAHIGGFVGGYAASRLLDPLMPERIDHVIIGVACLAISVLSVAYSALPLLTLLR